VSSLHDRACELYYALKGGTGKLAVAMLRTSLLKLKYVVDYGEEHGKRHHHLRYGRTIAEGIYPLWSKERPLHFLGHSLVINQLLALEQGSMLKSMFREDLLLSNYSG
jgi:hypothetical protein